MPKLSWILKIVRPAARKVALRLASKHEVHGIQLADLVLGGGAESTARVDVANAIELINKYDPARLQRIQRDVRYVVVTATAGTAGEYWEDLRSILLDASNAQRQTVEAIAMVIVHEATHARLWRMGVGRCPDREKIERICVRSEIAFARKVPGTDRLIEGAKLKLASRYWESSRAQDVETYLEKLGFPRWARRLLS